MLVINHLKKSFKDHIIFDDVHLEVNKNDWVIITGKSGSGKTTLLKMMTGLLDYDDGEIMYEGKVLHHKDFEGLRRNEWSIVFQEKNFIEEYSIYQNLSLINDHNEDIDALLEYFHLMDLKYKKVSQLSSGELQRVSIIRALLKNAKVLFLDEPTGNLDNQSTNEVIKMLKEVNKSMTIIMISHDHDLFQYADQVITIHNQQLSITENNQNKKDIKTTNYSPFKMSLIKQFKMALWNFKYYLKTYVLGIIIFVCLCTGFVFSRYIGEGINSAIKQEMIKKDTEYELVLTSDEVLSIDDVKQFSKTTNSKNYDLCLNLFLEKNENHFNVDHKEFVFENTVHFLSEYSTQDHIEDVGISSALFNKLKLGKNDKNISIDVDILSDFKEDRFIYWVDDDYKVYEPVYIQHSIDLSDYQIIEEDEYNIYLSHDFIESLANTYNHPLIQTFKVNYDSYDHLSSAKQYFEDHGLMTFSIYDDFKNIENEIETEFVIFKYSSYVMLIIIYIVMLFILYIIYSHKRNQRRIIKELGMSFKDQCIVNVFENLILSICIIALSFISTMLFIQVFEGIYEIQSFLPQSLLEIAATYTLPLQNIRWFNVETLEILKCILIVSVPVLLLSIVIFNLKNYERFD